MSSIIDTSLTLPSQLKAIREDAGVTQSALAERAGVGRLTAMAAEGKSDPRLSSLAALFDALGYALLPIPKPLVRDVAAFVNNGGRHIALPAGIQAPLSVGQAAFQGPAGASGESAGG